MVVVSGKCTAYVGHTDQPCSYCLQPNLPLGMEIVKHDVESHDILQSHRKSQGSITFLYILVVFLHRTCEGPRRKDVDLEGSLDFGSCYIVWICCLPVYSSNFSFIPWRNMFTRLAFVLLAWLQHVQGGTFELTMLDVNGTPQLLKWNSSSQDITSLARKFGQIYQNEPAVCEANAEGDTCHWHAIEVYMRLLRGQAATKRRAKGLKTQASDLESMSLGGLGRVDVQGAAIALFSGHDANIAVSVNGHVKCVLELERLFGVRYFLPNFKNKTSYTADWLQALATVRDLCECDAFPERFQHGIVVASADTGFGEEAGLLPEIVKKIFTVDEWHLVKHAAAHAAMSYYSSPFRSALVVVYDANFGAFTVQNGQMKELTRLDYNLGTLYLVLGALMPEVSNLPDEYMDHVCNYQGEGNLFPADIPLSWSGKLMGYSASGSPKGTFRQALRIAFEASALMPQFPAETLFANSPAMRDLGNFFVKNVLPELCASVDGQRDFAASIQAEFQDLAYDIITTLLEYVGSDHVDGLVLTGGCALNVLTNQLMHDTLASKGASAPGIHVPVAPNDCGLAVGGLWAITPPMRSPQPLQYLGFRLWDAHLLEKLAHERQARRLVDGDLTVAEQLAEILTGPRFPIVAVVRGRQEFGPRALGHRSLLAVPNSNEMRERMNRVKARQWYRPVAPMIADEDLEKAFGRVVKSPFMSMAPKVLDDIAKKFPALVHLDGTARHQSVGAEDEPFIHALLLAVGRRTGLAALINTSFNTKGKPITNSVVESLEMLDNLPDLDYVLIEDWLFQKQKK